MELNTLPSLASAYAAIWHRDQTYGDQTYFHGHLTPVVGTIMRFAPDDYELIAAGWLHDGPEDSGDSRVRDARLELIRAEMGMRTHRLVWSVTGIGSNRKERNASAYQKIALSEDSPLLKSADRLINSGNSKRLRTPLHKMYVREYPDFRSLVESRIPAQLLAELDAVHTV